MAIINPFGPLMYKERSSDEFLKYLQDEVVKDTIEEASDVGTSLAGNIKSQYDAKVDPKRFMDYISPHVMQYIYSCQERYESIKASSLGVREEVSTQIEFHMGEHGPWLNIQRQHEFNPVHSHAGQISSALMIDIPDEIEEEQKSWKDKSNMPCPGQLDFINDTGGYQWPGSFKVIPKTGDLYLFPASLKHCVYPFYSDVKRITMSFNVFDIKYGSAMEPDD